MNVLEKYNAALDARAEEFRVEAEHAKQRGDERDHSMALMQQSMLGDMLKALGRAEHESRRGILQKQIDAAEQSALTHRQCGDFDAADRDAIKARTIRWAKELLERLEAEDA